MFLCCKKHQNKGLKKCYKILNCWREKTHNSRSLTRTLRTLLFSVESALRGAERLFSVCPDPSLQFRLEMNGIFYRWPSSQWTTWQDVQSCKSKNVKETCHCQCYSEESNTCDIKQSRVWLGLGQIRNFFKNTVIMDDFLTGGVGDCWRQLPAAVLLLCRL